MKRSYFILVLITYLSCNNYTTTTDLKGNIISKLYSNGNYVKYYPNGMVKEIRLTSNSDILSDNEYSFLKLDTIKDLQNKFNNKYYLINYNREGFISSKGFIDSMYVKTGVWNYYKNNFKYDVEYFNIEGKPFVNRIWSQNYKSGIVNNLYYIKTEKDTFRVGERVRLKIYLTYPILSYKSEIYVLLPKNGEENVLKDDFSNIRDIEYDTIKNLKELLKKNGKKFSNFDGFKVVVDLIYSKPGKKSIKGILVEQYKTKDTTFINELLFKKSIYIIK